MQKPTNHFLKRVATYFLIFIVSFAYNIETVKYLLKAIGDSSSIVCVDDFQCDENDSEEKESEKTKEEKQFFADDYFLNNHHFIFYAAELKNLGFAPQKTISSFDYRQEVYSPPEL